MEITTDCKSPDGITVGIIDAIITLCHLLQSRSIDSQEAKEALRDLLTDDSFKYLFSDYVVSLVLEK